MSVQKIPASAGFGSILEAFKQDGAVIIQNFLTPDQVSRFNADIEPELAKISAGKPAEMMDYYEGADDAYGAQTKRLMDVPNISKTFREEVLEVEILHQLCERIFTSTNGTNPGNGYWVNAVSVIEIGPGNPAQPLHRDQEQWDLWNSCGPSAPEATVNFLMALSPSTDENGATRIVPGSHRWPVFDTSIDGDGAEMRKHNTIAAELNPGDCVFFSGKLLHGGGANKTANELRRCVALSMVRMGLMPEHAYPLLTPIEVADTLTYRAQAMLGFRSLWPPSATGTAGYFWTKDYLEVGRFLGLKDKPLYPTGIATSG